MRNRTPRTIEREFRSIATAVEALVEEAASMKGHEYFPVMVRHSLDTAVSILRTTEQLRKYLCQPRCEFPLAGDPAGADKIGSQDVELRS